ncbi:MAG: capsule biosynthesis protein [Pseudomonadota bacterium]
MTTKPKAKRFRIRRSASASADRAPAAERAPAPDEDGFGAEPFPTARKAQKPASPPAAKPAAANPGMNVESRAEGRAAGERVAGEIDAIRNEGLTARQLRMARRLAHKHGLAPTSDFDAVRLLRKAGIDPFQRANMLELVVAETPETAPPPAAPKSTGTEISTEVADPAQRRAREIQDIQRDIARRRRGRVFALAFRLMVFVAMPTIIAGLYFYVEATPMYSTKSEFVIQQADANAGGGMGGLFAGTGMATSQDSITVQSYLGSREAMLRLNDDLGFKAHFATDDIDVLQRLEPGATNEEAYRLYRKHVKIGYDPTEGIIRMEVIAAEPEVSAAFSRALIGYAEEQVDQLTQRLREDQMEGANRVFAEAEAKMVAAQQTVLDLQERLGVLDPASETSAIMGQISNFETQLAEKRLQLQQLLDNPAPNAARVSGTEGDISRLEALVADLRSQLTESTAGEGSLARTSGQLRMAEVDLETRTLMMQEALQALESARTEANRQVRYLSLGVNPVPPDEATYPRAFENTLLAALIFAGIYLMISLTASILREQVSG